MGGGGKSGTSVTIGYRYYMGAHITSCHGPVDSVNAFIFGERVGWEGAVTESTTIEINQPELFGGDDREGGVVGSVDVLMGEATQPRNEYLSRVLGPTCSAYRGVLSFVFRGTDVLVPSSEPEGAPVRRMASNSFQWSSGNPYFKAPWISLTRILSGWSGGVWNPEDAVVVQDSGHKDMNPAHIIFQCLTDTAWGMGYNYSDVDDASFRAAAATLKAEKFGLSLAWDEQSTIEDFIKVILDHISGSLALDLSSGKFVLRLIRDDYNIGDLVELNEDNVLAMRSFQRVAFGDSANEIVLTYTDRDQSDKTVTVQDLAAISAQGGVSSMPVSYPGIRDDGLASKVALRELRTVSANLAKVEVTTNRVLWDKEIGDVVRLVWPTRGIAGVAFRITEISKGTLTDGKISATLVEDVFGLPQSSYTSAPSSQWVDVLVPPVAADAAIAVEAPYWEVVRNMPTANQAYLEPGYGFGLLLAARGAVQSAYRFSVAASPDDEIYSDVATGHFVPTGTLVSGIDRVAESVTLTGALDLDSVVLSSDGGYAYIDDECVAITSCDPSTGLVGIKRAVLDTQPATHAPGARVFFMTPGVGYDTTERTAGETVYYRPRPSTGLGTLNVEDAETETLVFNSRAERPYPPGNLRVDGSPYPTTITGPGVTITWAHRDRTAQTVDLVDHTVGSIGPEEGVSYRLRLYTDAGVLLHTYEIAGTETSWSYPSDHDAADGNRSVLHFTLHAVRDGLESWQAASHAFQRSVVSGNVGIESPPSAPVLTGTPGGFEVYLSWVFGDGRTNIDKIEIRVGETSELAKSTVLQYLDFPDQDYTHEIERVGVMRWYWARVIDVNGQMSPWSNMVSARPLRVDPAQTLVEIEGRLNETHLDAELNSRINLIDAPGTGLVTRIATVETVTEDQATRITAVEAVASQNTSAIQQEQTARAGADAALAQQIDTLSATTASNAAAIQTEQTARATADSSLAQQITALQVQTGGQYAAIQQELTVQGGDVDTLKAQYVLKLDVNGKIAGIGLSNTGVTSEFAVIADVFRFSSPGGDKTPFAIVESPPGSGNWQTLLNSDVLIGGDVQIANLKSGALASDVMMSLGGGVIELDGAGEIRVFKDLSPTADYVRLSSGEIRFMRYIGGAYQTYNYLSRLETGVANSGTTVTIPGYWKAQPRVMVSPSVLALYKKDYGNQDQAIACSALNIRETFAGSSVWRFDATATLSLAATSGGAGINNSSGPVSANSYSSATQVTPANCTSIVATVQVRSQRGNGVSQYFYRTVRWRVEYWSGSAWVAAAWRNVNMGAQFAAIDDSVSFTFPSAGTWQWRVIYEAYDTDGTVFGSVGYEYAEDDTATNTNTVTGTAIGVSGVNTTTSTGALSIPYSTSGGWEVYQVRYTYEESHRFWGWSEGLLAGRASVRAPGYRETSTVAVDTPYVTRSVTVSAGFSSDYVIGSAHANNGVPNFIVSSELRLRNARAHIWRRRPIANSTAPENIYTLSSYTYNLTDAQVLATGSLNWMAVGE